MRTISTSKLNTPSTATTSTLAPMATTTSSPAIRTSTHSPWHSPIPYLFGGLVAMLGLIAFALLVLACSYWRFSNQPQNQEGGVDDNNIGDLENKEGNNEKKEPFKAYEEKILVIMAGEEKPTFLATPVICSTHGKHLGIDCGTKIGKSKSSFNVFEKETLDKDNHVIVHATITITLENEGSQETQQQQLQQLQQQQNQ